MNAALLTILCILTILKMIQNYRDRKIILKKIDNLPALKILEALIDINKKYDELKENMERLKAGN